MATDTAIVTTDLNKQTHTHEIASCCPWRTSWIDKSLPYFAARNLATLVWPFQTRTWDLSVYIGVMRSQRLVTIDSWGYINILYVIYVSYCLDCASDSDLQFTFSVCVLVTNFHCSNWRLAYKWISLHTSCQCQTTLHIWHLFLCKTCTLLRRSLITWEHLTSRKMQSV